MKRNKGKLKSRKIRNKEGIIIKWRWKQKEHQLKWHELCENALLKQC